MEKSWRNSYLKSVTWVRELQKYDRAQIADLFGLDESCWDYEVLLTRLQKEGILRLVSSTETEDVEECDTSLDGVFYAFTYVGLYCYHGHLVCSLPKYVTNTEFEIQETLRYQEQSPSEWLKMLTQILQVLRVYERKKVEKNLVCLDASDDSQSYLSILITILEDYVEYGAYRVDEHVLIEIGYGRIMWTNTINTCTPCVKANKPVYVDVISRHLVDDEDYFITRLHRVIVKECYDQLSRYGVLQLLELPDVDYVEENVEELGDLPFLSYCVEQEMCNQFDSRRRYVLQLLTAYLASRNFESAVDTVSYTFGSNCFYLVWEDVCRSTLGRDEKDKFSIVPPIWSLDEGKKATPQPLKLDMLFIEEGKAYVMDAKYYLPRCPMENQDRVIHLPGVEDITKQFLYKQAIMNKEALRANDSPPMLTRAYNAFLMPQPTEKEEGEHVQHYASVTMPLFANERIDTYRLVPAVLYDAYIKGIECREVRDALRRSLELNQRY